MNQPDPRLDDLVARGDEAGALRWAPRERAGSGEKHGAMIYGRRADGSFVLRPDDDGVLRVALAPGARWPTKRWPDAHAVALLRGQLARDDRRVVLLLGAEDADWLARTGAADLADHPRLDVLAGRPLTEVAAALGRCRAAVTNDSGLLHLSEAVGTPVTALFGPTVRAFGYAPLLPASRLLETDLDCRPCSRTGSRPCHRGDLACLASLAPEQVSEALEQVLAAAGGR